MRELWFMPLKRSLLLVVGLLACLTASPALALDTLPTCAKTSDCVAGQGCIGGFCEARESCTTPADCEDPIDMCVFGLCIPEVCTKDAACVLDDLYCRVDQFCVRRDCNQSSDCGSDKLCLEHRCLNTCGPTLSCASDQTCQPGGFCLPAACTQDADCQGCGSDASCLAFTAVCDTEAQVCRQRCLSDADCLSGARCYGDGTCIAATCAKDTDCGRDGFLCRASDSRCISAICRYDGDCQVGELCLQSECRQDPTLYVEGGVSSCAHNAAPESFAALAFLFMLLAHARRRRT